MHILKQSVEDNAKPTFVSKLLAYNPSIKVSSLFLSTLRLLGMVPSSNQVIADLYAQHQRELSMLTTMVQTAMLHDACLNHLLNGLAGLEPLGVISPDATVSVSLTNAPCGVAMDTVASASNTDAPGMAARPVSTSSNSSRRKPVKPLSFSYLTPPVVEGERRSDPDLTSADTSPTSSVVKWSSPTSSVVESSSASTPASADMAALNTEPTPVEKVVKRERGDDGEEGGPVAKKYTRRKACEISAVCEGAGV